MNILNDIVEDVKSSHGNEVSEEEAEQFFSSYVNFYRENINCPKLGFTSVVSWFTERRNEFNEAFKSAGIHIIETVPEEVHDYVLTKTGLGRIEELYRKIHQ